MNAATPPAQGFSPRRALAAGLCLLLALAPAGCEDSGGGENAGLAEQASTPDLAPSSFLMDVDTLPREETLSPDAVAMAAYLALMQAISFGDEDQALLAAEDLAAGVDDNVLPVARWLECALWFMERKSVNAIPFLRQARVAHPEDISLLMLHTEALASHGFDKEALRELADYLARHPGDPDALLQTGVIHLNERRAQEALAVFETLQGKDRGGMAEFYQARALAALGRSEEALRHLRVCVKLLPDFGEALSELAFLSEGQEDYKTARWAYEKLLAMNQSVKEISLRLISLSLKMNQPDRARAYYKNGPDDVRFKMVAASLFSEARHYLQAESILKDVASRPDAPREVYLFLADITYEQRHDLAAAMAWLDRVPDTGSHAQRKLLLAAQLQAESNSVDQALATIRRGKEQFPTVPDFVNLEARVLSHAGRLKEALTVARDAVSRWPESTDLAFLLGNLLAEDGQKAEAFATMEGIIEKEPEHYHALNFVGYTLAEENRDIERALDLLTRANAIAPRQFFILDSLAWAHFRAGHLDKAWTYIREAARLDTSGDPAIWEHYGDIAARRGQKKEARSAYQKALERGPANAEDIKKRMGEL